MANPEAPRYGSDVMVDLMRGLEIPYVTLNPGASFRGLHDSLVNRAGAPEMILCPHEKLAVQMAHGYAKASGRTMAAILAPRLPEGATLVPVPLHRWRLWGRGFNQSVAIARALQSRKALPCSVEILRRDRATPSLRGLDPNQRRRAVKGAFTMRGRLDVESREGLGTRFMVRLPLAAATALLDTYNRTNAKVA